MMYAEEIDRKVRLWAEQSLFALRELLPLMAPVSTFGKWGREEKETLAFLLTACARSSESAVLLVAFGQLWDAEVLVRSVAEGSLKVCYLLQSQETFAKRHEEYSHDLWRIALLKDHKKATDLLAALAQVGKTDWRPIRERLLPRGEFDEINSSYPQGLRRALEQRWGFTGLLGELARSGDPRFEKVAGYAHDYSMASHILHVDSVGAGLPLERDYRTEDRRNAIQLAHAGKLLSSVLAFLQLRLLVGYDFVGHDRRPLKEAWTKVEELLSRFGDVYDAWLKIEYPD